MNADEERLDQLDDLLGSLPEGFDPMMASEMDGFMAGLIICPDLIPPSQWVPKVLGMSGGGAFENLEQVRAVYDAVMEHYNAIVAQLMEGEYGPTCDVFELTGEVMWGIWAEGFAQCLDAYPLGWRAIFRSGNADVIAAFAGLKRLADIARDETGKLDTLNEEEWSSAPGRIARWVLEINNWRLEQADFPGASARGKLGRNEPCPCGSGKKYKKCCGLN